MNYNYRMKIAKHICFFYLKDRIKYLNIIIEETNKYEYNTDIFIHTNKPDLDETFFIKYNNGLLKIIYHDLTNCDNFKLTWKCRELIKNQRYSYDIFMYLEDDILVKFSAIKYWLKYSNKTLKKNYNLGFVRIETKDNIDYVLDITVKLNKKIILDDEEYCINDINPYCAFWIYNKDDFNKFVETPFYNFIGTSYYGTREQSAIGLHGKNFNYYKNTIIPVNNNKLIEQCKIYHLSNNYVNDNTKFATIPFDNVINF